MQILLLLWFCLFVLFIRNLLNKRFDEIDFENAKEDVIPFIKKTDVLDIWSKEFFKEISLNLESK